MVIGWPTEGPTRIWVGIAWIWSGLFVAISLSSFYRRPSNWRKQAWLQQFIRSRTISKRHRLIVIAVLIVRLLTGRARASAAPS